MAVPNKTLYAWLTTQVAPYRGPLPMLWTKFLTKNLYTFPTIEAGIFEYLGDLGYTGKFDKRWSKWYNNVIIGNGGLW